MGGEVQQEKIIDPPIGLAEPDEVESTIDELAEWLKSVVRDEGFVDAGFVLVIRNNRVVRKRRIHESME